MKKVTIIKHFILLVTSVFLLCGLSSAAQSHFTYTIDKTIRFDHMGVKDVLSSERIYNIHQDKYGFIWMITARRVDIYNGYEIKSLPESAKQINKICEEKDETIWFIAGKGMMKFNMANNSLKYFLPDTNNINHKRNKKILKDGNQLGCDNCNGLYQFNSNPGNFAKCDKFILHT